MMADNYSDENQTSTFMAEKDPTEETLQLNVAETPDPPSLPRESTDSNDKDMFAKPYLPNEASSPQSIDCVHSTSAQVTQSAGHVESQSSVSTTLSSTNSLFVHIGSYPTSPDSGASIESFESVSMFDSQYIRCEETQSVASGTISSTANVMVHLDRSKNIAELGQKTMPTRKSVNVEDGKTVKSLFERKSVSIDSGTQVYVKETVEEIVHGALVNKNLPSHEIKKQLNNPAVEESFVRAKEISNTDKCKKNLIEQAATKNTMQLKEQLQVDKGNVRPSFKNADESKMQLREQVSAGKMLRNQGASKSKVKQDPAFVATSEQYAANTEDNLQLSPDILLAASATSDPTTRLPGASSTQQESSRYPPRKVKLTADDLPSWRNMTMTEARKGRGMYGGRYRQCGEDSPPKEKRPSAFAKDMPVITVENIKKYLGGQRYVKFNPSPPGQPPYRSLTERLYLEKMAKLADLTKKKKKKKRRSRYACADDYWSSLSSSDEEPKSPKKSLPPSPELQFHLEL